MLTISPLWPVVPMKGALGGSLCRADSCDLVPYVPFWTANGVTLLDRQLSGTAENDTATDGPTVVFAYSNGALVAARWMAQYTDVSQAPTPDELSFVLIGNPARGHGGTIPSMPPSDYHVLDVVRQYDPLADFPDNPFNLLALANIAAGIVSPIHLDYTNVDIDDPANIRWTEGTTTYVFVPTENLPLLTPLRLIGMSWLADALNEPLTEIVESAYDRSYLPTAPTDQPDDAPDDTASEPEVADLATTDPAVTDPADAPAVGADDAAPVGLATVGDGDDATAGPTGESEAPAAASVESPDGLADAPDPEDPTNPTDEEADAATAEATDTDTFDADTFEGNPEKGADEKTASDELAPAEVTPQESADTQQPEARESSDTGGE